MLKNRSSTMLATCRFKFLNADWHSVGHIYIYIYLFFRLSSGRSGAEVSASAGKNLCKLRMEPIKDFSCSKVRGGFSILIGSVFRTNGVMPVGVILCPSHSQLFYAKSHFVSFSDMFSLSSFRRIFSTVAI